MSFVTEDERGAAFRLMKSDDAEGFARMLAQNPDLLPYRYPVGESWLHRAAEYESVRVMQLLVERGLPVDIQDENGDTPISNALMQPALRGARWLLDHGASVQGVGAGALLSATYSKNLDAVKLVVEGGADVNKQRPEPALSVLQFARAYGTAGIIEYLLANGAKERVPDIREAIKRHIVERHGPLQSVDATLPARLEILMLPESGDDKQVSLLTVGAHSTSPDGASQDTQRYIEFKISLPTGWPLSGDISRRPEHLWPVDWLAKLVEYLRAGHMSLPGRFAIITNHEPPEPVAPSLPFTAFLLAQDLAPSFRFEVATGWVEYYTLFPLFPEEVAFEKANDIPSLLARFQAAGVGPFVRLDRANVALDSFAAR